VTAVAAANGTTEDQEAAHIAARQPATPPTAAPGPFQEGKSLRLGRRFHQLPNLPCRRCDHAGDIVEAASLSGSQVVRVVENNKGGIFASALDEMAAGNQDGAILSIDQNLII